MAAAMQTLDVGRPKLDKSKDVPISTRTYSEVRNAIDEYARAEHRTTSQMVELLLREAIIARRKKDRRKTDDIESLP